MEIAIHDFGRPESGSTGVSSTAPVVLFSHATGFHGWCYQPIAAHLTDRFHCLALDYRGFGDSPADPHEQVDWWEYAKDAEAVVQQVSDGRPIIGFGHSMGGTALLMASLTLPAAFAGIVTFEPIIIPGGAAGAPPPVGDNSNALSVGARRRRSTFDSFEAAFDNYASKPPFNGIAPEALHAYVDHGFRLGDDGRMHLKCTPAHEADTFDAATQHHLWDRLAEIVVPTWVLSGERQPAQPSNFAELIAAQINGAVYREFPEYNHFGPLQDPAGFAEIIGDIANRLTRS